MECEILGEGSYGRVYKAISSRYGKVAVKINNKHNEDGNLVNCIKEINFFSLLKNHPLFVACKRINYTDKDTQIMLECGEMDGSVFIKSPVSSGEKKLFICHLLLATEYLHSLKIYHRDIKPENVICFFKDGKLIAAKLTDFGLSMYYCQHEIEIKNLATLPYRSPEILQGKAFDYKMDVWSIGCVVYELIKKTRLFSGSTQEKMLISIRKFFENTNTSIESLKTKLYSLLNLTSEEIVSFEKETIENRIEFGTFDEYVDLLANLLIMNPDKRYSCSQALNHPFFQKISKIINSVRTASFLDNDGQHLFNKEKLVFLVDERRKKAMDLFKNIYEKRKTYNWYNKRMFIHAIDLYDRFHASKEYNPNYTIHVSTFLFLSSKFFKLPYEECNIRRFLLYPDVTILGILEFERYCLKHVFNGIIYFETLYEAYEGFMTEEIYKLLIFGIMDGKYPPKMLLKKICEKL